MPVDDAVIPAFAPENYDLQLERAVFTLQGIFNESNSRKLKKLKQKGKELISINIDTNVTQKLYFTTQNNRVFK